jgi:cytochrome c-type biogenesis protein CcmE
VDVTPHPLGDDVGEASVDAGPDDFDLTPRDRPARRARRWPAMLAIAIIVAAIVFVAFKGLGDASLYFYNADEAVEMRDELGDDRFRLQGTVVPESVVSTDDGIEFTVVYRDVEVDVRHTGDPPDLFQEDIPVVVEGAWTDDDIVESDGIVVKHTEVYEEDNSERLREAETDARADEPEQP